MQTGQTFYFNNTLGDLSILFVAPMIMVVALAIVLVVALDQKLRMTEALKHCGLMRYAIILVILFFSSPLILLPIANNYFASSPSYALIDVGLQQFFFQSSLILEIPVWVIAIANGLRIMKTK